MDSSEVLRKQPEARLCSRFMMLLRLLSIERLPSKFIMSTTTRLPIYPASPLSQLQCNTRIENRNQQQYQSAEKNFLVIF